MYLKDHLLKSATQAMTRCTAIYIDCNPQELSEAWQIVFDAGSSDDHCRLVVVHQLASLNETADCIEYFQGKYGSVTVNGESFFGEPFMIGQKRVSDEQKSENEILYRALYTREMLAGNIKEILADQPLECRRKLQELKKLSDAEHEDFVKTLIAPLIEISSYEMTEEEALQAYMEFLDLGPRKEKLIQESYCADSQAAGKIIAKLQLEI